MWFLTPWRNNKPIIISCKNVTKHYSNFSVVGATSRNDVDVLRQILKEGKTFANDDLAKALGIAAQKGFVNANLVSHNVKYKYSCTKILLKLKSKQDPRSKQSLYSTLAPYP